MSFAWSAGVACSAGTFAGGELTHSGDRATASGAADLLLHPMIEAAVRKVTEQFRK